MNEDPAHRGVRFPDTKVNLPQLPPRCPPFIYGELRDVLPDDGMLDGEFVDPATAYSAINELKVDTYRGHRTYYVEEGGGLTYRNGYQ